MTRPVSNARNAPRWRDGWHGYLHRVNVAWPNQFTDECGVKEKDVADRSGRWDRVFSAVGRELAQTRPTPFATSAILL
jgi:hypothetical protein